MAVFPHIQTEKIVQVGDRTRISVAKTLVVPSTEEITSLEVRPDADAIYRTVTDQKYLDWVYETAGTKTVTLKVTTPSETVEKSAYIQILEASEDNLFSTDEQLISLEPDIMSLLPDSRVSYLNVHREAQTQIMDAIYQRGITDQSGLRLTPASVVDVHEVSEWSKFLTLTLIFRGRVNAPDDAYIVKAQGYEKLANQASQRAFLKLDLDGDGKTSADESVSITSVKVSRR